MKNVLVTVLVAIILTIIIVGANLWYDRTHASNDRCAQGQQCEGYGP